MVKNILCIIIISLLMIFSSPVFGAEITLEWDANTEEDLEGYYIYYKADTCCEPYQGTGADRGKSPIQVPLSQLADQKNPEVLISGLDENRAYYFVVSAYIGEVESGYSNEVKIKAPQITSQPIETYVSNNAVTIEWKTDELGNSEARYGLASAEWNAYPKAKISNTEGVKTHNITLTNLLPATTYHYRSGTTNDLGFGPDLEDDDANPSRDYDFITTTDVQDEIPPQFIILPFAASITNTNAFIEWETNEPSNYNVKFGTTLAYGQTISRADQYTSYHSVELSGLYANTQYYVKVDSADTAGNTVSYNFTFPTEGVVDSSSPTFTSAPTVTAITDTTAIIEWTTNEPSSTKVRYGIESALWSTYPSRIQDFDRVTNHLVMITGLTADTLYYWRAGSADSSGNQTLTNEFTFATASNQDTSPPRITTTPTVISISNNTATIVWDTDEPSSSSIRYWDDSWLEPRTWENYQYTKNRLELVNHHVVTLTNLKEQTRYKFMVGSTDPHGNGPTISGESGFATEQTPDTIAPQIVAPPAVTAKTNNSVTIEWTTDEPSNSIVKYGTNSSTWNNYPITYFNPVGVTSHRVIITGLDSGTVYFFQVGGSDIFNNGPNTSPDDRNPFPEMSVITETYPDKSPPQIIGPPTVTAKTNNVAVVEWSTDESSNSIVQYGLTSGNWNSYAFTESISESVVDHSVVLTNLEAGQKYYLRVGSVDEYGNGPETTHEIFFMTDIDSDTSVPRITIPPTVIGITDSAVTIVWETDEPSNSIVKYMVEPESGNEPKLLWDDTALSVYSANQMVTRHTATITNLSPGIRYYFIVGSIDAAGNGPDSGDAESNNPFTQDLFYTEIARDEEAPNIISGPTVTSKDNQSAIIEWETDEPSNSVVRYDTTGRTWYDLSYDIADYDIECVFDDDGLEEECYPIDEYGNRIIEQDNGSESDVKLVTQHSVTITGLQPTTTYYYRVGSTDTHGNGPDLNQDMTNPSGLDEFMTNEGPDEVAPAISNLRVFFVTNTTALITWDTDEPSNSIIQYGIKSDSWGEYPFEESDADMVRYHSVTITGLQSDSLYYFRTGSSDAKGNGPFLNEATQVSNPSNEMTFRSAIGPDVTAPQISNFRITKTNDETAIIEWLTDEPGNSQVRYDTESNFWQNYKYGENDAEMVTEHRVTITGLSPSTLYYIRVSSTDASGNNYDTSFNDKNPSNEYNTITSDADPPSFIVYPEVGYPAVDSVNNTIEISYDELNMQNATVEANYFFSPGLTFSDAENPIYQINASGNVSTYRLSFVLIPEYTIFTLTALEDITDADGHRVEPATILINDNDADGLPDDWEVAVGLDPTSAEGLDGQGSSGDFDGDGYTNYDEFINQTNPTDSKDFPSHSTIVDVLPHDNAGIDDNFRVANNSSFAVFISDRKGIDINNDTSVVFTIDDGINESYRINLGDTDVLRVIKMNRDELDTSVTQLWAVYDRSRDGQYGVFPFETVVNVSIRATNRLNDVVEGSFSFGIETESEHSDAIDPKRMPNYAVLNGDDPDFDDDIFLYNSGYQLIPDELPAAKIIYHSNDITPEISPLEDLPPFDVTGANAIGMPMNLGPPTIFNVPVKLIIPVPADVSVKALSIYVHNGKEWVLGCDTSGKSPNLNGWLVPGSRVNGKNRIEFKVYHFSGIQAALLGEGTGGGVTHGGSVDNPDEVGSCFIGDLPEFKPAL